MWVEHNSGSSGNGKGENSEQKDREQILEEADQINDEVDKLLGRE